MVYLDVLRCPHNPATSSNSPAWFHTDGVQNIEISKQIDFENLKRQQQVDRYPTLYRSNLKLHDVVFRGNSNSDLLRL